MIAVPHGLIECHNTYIFIPELEIAARLGVIIIVVMMMKEHPMAKLIPLHRFAVLYTLLWPSLATMVPVIARVQFRVIPLVQRSDCAKHHP